MKQESLVNGALVLVSVCAILSTAAAVVRTVRPASPSPAPPVATELKEWRQAADGGYRAGSDSAPVIITEFLDFQCPYCRQTAMDIARLRQTYGTTLAVVYRHYPLDRIHPYAHDAALAAACAARLGRFEQYHDALFASQDSIGRTPWADFALRAGVRDTAAFRQCIEHREGESSLQRDIRAGDAVGILGTPTVLVNQYMLSGAPRFTTLDSLIRLAARAHR